MVAGAVSPRTEREELERILEELRDRGRQRERGIGGGSLF